METSPKKILPFGTISYRGFVSSLKASPNLILKEILYEFFD
jgi:hypothetical protein